MTTAPIFSSCVGLTAPHSSAPLTTPITFPGSGASPSLPALLATLLSSLGSARSTSVVQSSALPPIPGKVVDAIPNGTYVDFKDLLPDNVALKQQIILHRDPGVLI